MDRVHARNTERQKAWWQRGHGRRASRACNSHGSESWLIAHDCIMPVRFNGCPRHYIPYLHQGPLPANPLSPHRLPPHSLHRPCRLTVPPPLPCPLPFPPLPGPRARHQRRGGHGAGRGVRRFWQGQLQRAVQEHRGLRAHAQRVSMYRGIAGSEMCVWGGPGQVPVLLQGAVSVLQCARAGSRARVPRIHQ